MALEKMSYKNYTWSYNPAEIVIEEKKNIKDFNIPFYNNVLQNHGRKKRVVRGSGEFFGADCIEQFQKLREVYAQKDYGYLKLPNMTPFLAAFYSLEMIGSASNNTIRYTFEFWEQIALDAKELSKESASYCVAKEGDTLWSISLRYDVSVNELLKMNPDVKRPDVLAVGQRVRLT